MPETVFGLPTHAIVVRTLAARATRGEVERDVVRQAVEKYQIGDVQAAPEDTTTTPEQQPEA